MSKNLKPKGRNNLPDELVKFGRQLVYSEGTKTEPLYVENIRKLIAKKYLVKPNDIEIVYTENKSNNTIYLVKDAIKDVKSRLKRGEIINHVWIFFDKDSFPKTDFDAAKDALTKMNNSKDLSLDGFRYDVKTNIVWHACYSNESFELWLCLYFDLISSSLGREKLKEHLNNIKNLKKINFEYEKNLKDIHDLLTNNGGSIENAIRNAKILSVNNGENPSTNVYEFAEYFKAYMI